MTTLEQLQQRAFKKGSQKMAKMIIVNMLREGIDKEFIARVTNQSLSKIEQLHASISHESQ